MQPAALIKTLIGLATGPVIRGLVNVFALKGLTVILGFVFITLAARAMGPHDFGVFSILFSAAGLFSIFATSGQQVLLMRSWNEYTAASDPARLKGALLFGLATFLGGAGVIALGFFAVIAQVYSAPMALAVTAYMVSLGLVLTTAHLVRASVGVVAGDGLGNLLPLFLPTLYLATALWNDTPASVSYVFLLFAAGAAIAIVAHIVLVAREAATLFPGFWSASERFDIATWRTRSFKLWLSNGLEATNQYIDVLLVGWLLNPTLAGAYFVITRLANIFAVAGDAIHFYASRHIPRFYFRREMDQLDHILNVIAITTIGLVLAGLVLMAVGGSYLLAIFSPAYFVYGAALAVLSLGTASVVAVGPAGVLLNFTGHEGDNLRIVAATVAVRVAGFVLIVPHFQIAGAITVTTLSFVLMATLLRAAALRLTGIDASSLRLLTAWRKLSVSRAAK